MNQHSHKVKEVKGFRTGFPKMCYFGMWIILSWRPCRLKRNFHLSLKEFKFGGFSIINVIDRNIFLWPIYRGGQIFNYWTSALLVNLWMTLLRSEASGAESHPSSECRRYLILPFCLWASHACQVALSCLWCLHIYMSVIKLSYFLLLMAMST